MIACSQQLRVIGWFWGQTANKRGYLKRKRKTWYIKTQTIAIAHLMCCQSGELGETDNTDCGGPGVWLPCFSLHHWGRETVRNVVELLDGNLTSRLYTYRMGILPCVYGCVCVPTLVGECIPSKIGLPKIFLPQDGYTPLYVQAVQS